MGLSELVSQVSAITQRILKLIDDINVINEGKGHNQEFKTNLEDLSSTSKASIQSLTQVTGRVSSPVKESFFENLIEQTSGSNMSDLKSGLDTYDGKLDTEKTKFKNEKENLENLVASIRSEIDQLKKDLTD